MSAPSQADLSAATAAQAQSESLRAAIASFIAALWAALGEYRNEQIPVFLGELLPYLSQVQQEMRDLTLAHLELQGVAPVDVSMDRVSGAAIRNGTTPETVYERPFHLVWRQLHDLPRVDGSIEAAIAAGNRRAQQAAWTDLQLTKTHTTQAALSNDPRVVGYRRVLEGEFSCGLCIVASTQRYRKGELLPIHPACDCSVAPIVGTHDPGQIINAPALETVHAAIDDTFGSSSASARGIPGARRLHADGSVSREAVLYRDVLVTHRHGEIGPVLAVRGRPFLSLTN